MKFRNLVIISNFFPDKNDQNIVCIWVKDQLRFLKKYFENIFVISPAPYGIEMLQGVERKDYSYDNVHVFYPKYLNIPFFYFRIPLVHFLTRKLYVKLEKKAILKLMKNKNISCDLIHSHFTWRSGADAIELMVECDVPIIITEHTSETFNRAINTKERLFIDAWEKADAIIRVRKDDINRFSEVGIPLEKVHYIPNGFDPDKFQPLDSKRCREQLGLPLVKKIILTIGSLEEVKGQKYLIESMELLTKRRNDVLCLIIGRGKLEKRLEQQMKKSNLNSWIKLLGEKPHNEIAKWINASDIFVLPSLNEGSPTVMFEVLGCGKPFIGSRIGGIPEIITSDDIGFLCEPGNSRELSDKISEALEKKWDTKRIQDYSKQFTLERIAEKIVKVYEKVLKKKLE